MPKIMGKSWENHGKHIGNTFFIWKIHENPSSMRFPMGKSSNFRDVPSAPSGQIHISHVYVIEYFYNKYTYITVLLASSTSIINNVYIYNSIVLIAALFFIQ
jgi:hypothetical protein